MTFREAGEIAAAGVAFALVAFSLLSVIVLYLLLTGNMY